MKHPHAPSQQTWFLAALIGLGIWGQLQDEVSAHGAYIETRNSTTVEIQASYDSGEPMAEAQVVIYEPGNPDSPRFEGETDSEGKFSFVPDQPGDWEATVRSAGHGAISTIPVSEEGTVIAALSTNPQLSPLQKITVGGAVVWGLVGTALYFSKK